MPSRDSGFWQGGAKAGWRGTSPPPFCGSTGLELPPLHWGLLLANLPIRAA